MHGSRYNCCASSRRSSPLAKQNEKTSGKEAEMTKRETIVTCIKSNKHVKSPVADKFREAAAKVEAQQSK
jgi:hypothetical protein